ncbi:MAG: sulfite exporter TauE/SafE family protein [Gemmatimonadetes bacterium]|nr:sulfite exporter TauE/SafE family protein [Gemmatimonadota bacterium]
MSYLLPWTTAFVVGLMHSFEPDHLAAVTTFVSRRPGAGMALRFGLQWGAGHAAAVLAAGGVLLVLGIRVPEALTGLLELAVGAVLILLGLWAIRAARALHAHEHTHADGTRHSHLHSHAGNEGHVHGHGLTLVGALHGLAGTGPVIALLPLTLVESRLAAGAYLAVFGAGTIAGMTLYALLAGLVYGTVAQRSVTLARALAAITGLAAIVAGGLWIARAA